MINYMMTFSLTLSMLCIRYCPLVWIYSVFMNIIVRNVSEVPPTVGDNYLQIFANHYVTEGGSPLSTMHCSLRVVKPAATCRSSIPLTVKPQS
jgi:hypothetical protein